MNNYFPVVAVQKEKEKIISDLVQAGIGIIILPGKVFNIVSLVLQAPDSILANFPRVHDEHKNSRHEIRGYNLWKNAQVRRKTFLLIIKRAMAKNKCTVVVTLRIIIAFTRIRLYAASHYVQFIIF